MGSFEKRAWNSHFNGGLGKRAWNSHFNGGLGVIESLILARLSFDDSLVFSQEAEIVVSLVN